MRHMAYSVWAIVSCTTVFAFAVPATFSSAARPLAVPVAYGQSESPDCDGDGDPGIDHDEVMECILAPPALGSLFNAGTKDSTKSAFLVSSVGTVITCAGASIGAGVTIYFPILAPAVTFMGEACAVTFLTL